ncbi:MAG: AAA family ATPase [Candidatus Bathyarchaeota archaeon]|nr:flagellar hook-basal body complex protein FliE [Candidatus Bathyarchaeota archaeon A05DMB-5]MDH7558516.1 AAA family ATPase [Candidatus Bathyarchaeota archaeon]
MSSNKLVVGLAGMPGAGKSLVVSAAKEMGYGIVVMGDVVREETTRRGLELNPQNIGKIMLELREKEGKSVIAKMCIPKIENAQESKILVDGIRSLNEVEEFKRHFPKFTLIAVHSPPETRFKRLYHRQRSDDPASWEIFHERDTRELSVGLGEAIAMAEHLIVNEEKYELVKQKAREVLRKVEHKWTK